MNQHQELVSLIKSFSLIAGNLWAVAALLLLWFGWRAAKRRDIRIHKRLMIVVVAMSLIAFEAWLMSFRYPQLAMTVPEGMEIWIYMVRIVSIIPLVGATLMLIARWRNSRPEELLGHFNTHHQAYGKVFILIWGFGFMAGLFNTMVLL